MLSYRTAAPSLRQNLTRLQDFSVQRKILLWHPSVSGVREWGVSHWALVHQQPPPSLDMAWFTSHINLVRFPLPDGNQRKKKAGDWQSPDNLKRDVLQAWSEWRGSMTSIWTAKIKMWGGGCRVLFRHCSCLPCPTVRHIAVFFTFLSGEGSPGGSVKCLHDRELSSLTLGTQPFSLYTLVWDRQTCS